MDRLIGIWALIFVRPMLVLGALVAAIGIALMLFAGSYFAVGAYSESGLDDLTVTQEESGLTQEVLTRGLATPETTPMPTSTVIPTVVATTGPAAVALASTPESTAPSTTAEADQQETTGTPADEGASESTESAEDSPYDEYGILRDYSHYVAQADSEALSEGIDDGFQVVGDLLQSYGGEPRPTRIIIPAIDLESPVVNLNIVVAGGDVFLYRATDTEVMLPEDVAVFGPSDGPTLSLVTCAPATTFSHRFIVNATLVGVARL